MIVRLHDLSARAPTHADLQAVTTLWTTCTNSTYHNEEEIHQRWRSASFQLHADAWMVVTRQSEIVAYADVLHEEHASIRIFVVSLVIHPDHRERGLAMLLLLLVEQRVRRLIETMPLSHQIILKSIVSKIDNRACEVFVREGYTRKHRFYRVAVGHKTGHEKLQKQLKIDLLIDDDHPLASGQDAYQCEVYEKVLRRSQDVISVQMQSSSELQDKDSRVLV